MEARSNDPTSEPTYYRVILEGIATDVETPDSFSLKLSTRMHASFPRVRSVVNRLPYVVKTHVTASQAKRLQGILEELGGKVRIEPQAAGPPAGDRLNRGTRSGERREERRASRQAAQAITQCPECGWEVVAGAKYCPLCLRKFRDISARPESLEARLPAANPLDIGDGSKSETTVWNGMGRRVLFVVIGAVVIVVWLLAK
jgi:hypothetical protein